MNAVLNSSLFPCAVVPLFRRMIGWAPHRKFTFDDEEGEPNAFSNIYYLVYAYTIYYHIINIYSIPV